MGENAEWERGADFNKARKEDFEKYMELHLSICEEKSLIGSGLHGLVFLTNGNSG